MTTKISITNQKRNTVVIDIEGVIGVAEESQFENPETKTATYEKFWSEVGKISDIQASKVVVNIRSTGGNVGDAILIHDSLCALKAEITTRCYGYVASAATIIAQAASRGLREISSNSLYLIHKSACVTEGNATELSQTLDLLDKTDTRIAAIYGARSGRSEADFLLLMQENSGKGRWLSPQEAVQAGLVDRVIKNSPLANNAAQMVAQLGLPTITNATSKNPETMNLTKRWHAMLQAVGISGVSEKRFSDKELDTIEQELHRRDKTISALVQDSSQLEANYTAQLNELRNKVAVLEAQNGKFRAMATMTIPKEDPSYADQKLSSNAEAYREDVQNFR